MSLSFTGFIWYYNDAFVRTTNNGYSHTDSDGNGTADVGEEAAGTPYLGTVTISGGVYPAYGSGINKYVMTGGAAPEAPAVDDIPEEMPTITAESFCFLTGTKVVASGPKGLTTVENLGIGDTIVNQDGNNVRVLWIGRQKVSTKFGFAERLQPVRILAGALGDNVPNEDLTVSNDHALFVDGILANAGALVNDLSIFRVPLDEFEDGTFTYYHIETEKHELILANNTPAETFIDNVSRQSFDNYQEYVDLFGEEREMDELPLPRAMSPRQLPKKIKARLAARAIELGYAEKAVA